ncbi:hypothetical protein [Tsukamurella sp. NPDC003166]|uniref:hypothetical protein n=1 Tax=Tsukamurella sp. NPDC003166 TaxID=3154444 RepID=UPI0033AF7A48
MSAKHRKASKLAAKRTAVAATAVGATAAVGLMGAPAQAAAATVTPNYTQIISDYSHAYDNFLLGAGNLGGAAGNAWNPIASQLPGGLLPTFTAAAGQDNLASLTGVLSAINRVLTTTTVPTDMPGLPSGNTIPGISQVPGIGSALGTVGTLTGPLSTVQGVLDTLGVLDLGPGGLLGSLGLPVGTVLGGIPTLDQLISGLELTDTWYTSSYSWLGMSGQTNANNLFATIPSLTAAKLVSGIVDNLTVLGQPIPAGGAIADLVSTTLAPLNTLATPSITAWLPSAGGTYGLPLGGSLGWFGAMPTLALGPVNLPIVSQIPPLDGASTSDTVVALPIGGFGLSAPLSLFQTGFINTPGLVLPTATGVTTVGGTTIGQFNIPMLPTPALYANTLRFSYFGTNGFNVNSGQTALTLPGLPVPIVYSMGGYNFGTTGMGFTLPSLFGVGLVPSFQIGTAPGQTSPDGLIPASVLNLLGPDLLPTQLTTVTGLLGLPDFMGQAGTALTPLYTGLVTPLLTPLSNLATEQYGPFLNGAASNALDLSKQFKDLSGKAADAIPATTQSSGGSAQTTQQPTPAITTFSTPANETQKPVVNPEETPAATPPAGDSGDTSQSNNTPDQTPAPAQQDQQQSDTGRHRTGTPVKDIAERITGGITKTGDKIADGINNAGSQITGSGSNNGGADGSGASGGKESDGSGGGDQGNGGTSNK